MDDRGRLVSVIDAAREAGAKAVEVLRVRRTTLEQGGARQSPVRREELSWTVRAWLEGGRGGVGRAAVAADAVRLAMGQAASAAPDLVAGPADRMAIRTGALGIDDHRHPTIADEDRFEILNFVERAFHQGGLRARALRYAEVRDERSWMSTRGVEASEAATTYELTATVGQGDVEVRHRIASRHFSDVASLPFGPELRRRLEPLVRPASPPPPGLPVVLEPRVVAELARALAPAFSARAVGSGGFLGAWLGKRLAAPILHLTDDAGLFGGLHTRGFDDRGVPPIAVALLREGVVQGLYHDPESARTHALRPTGHVTDGELRPSNLIVRPGARTRNVILTDLRNYLALDRLPPADLATGLLEGVVPAVVVENGERVGSVRLPVRASFHGLLMGIREVASDQERACEVDAPTAVFEGDVRSRLA